MTDQKDIAVIGSGYWGKNLVRTFHALGRLNIICDSDTERLESIAKEYEGTKTSQNYEDVLQLEEVKGIVIATPAVTHHALVKQALLSGKDVFVEKPLALNLVQGEELLKIAKEQRAILMVGHILEYHPAFLKIQELIKNGEIGNIRYIYSNRLNFGKIRREENILWSFAPHDVALVLRMIGELPLQVIALGGAYIQPNIADVTVTQMLFNNGVTAHIFVSWLNPFKEQKFVIVGSKKMIQFDDVHKQLVLHDLHVDLEKGEPVPIKGEGAVIKYSSEEPLKLECEAFLNTIKTRKPALTDGESGYKVLQVLQAAQRSLNLQGKPQDILEKEMS